MLSIGAIDQMAGLRIQISLACADFVSKAVLSLKLLGNVVSAAKGLSKRLAPALATITTNNNNKRPISPHSPAQHLPCRPAQD